MTIYVKTSRRAALILENVKSTMAEFYHWFEPLIISKWFFLLVQVSLKIAVEEFLAALLLVHCIICA
jgi:hypothetical protein